MIKQCFDYSLEVTMVFLLRRVNPQDATADRLMATKNRRQVGNDGFRMIVLPGWNQWITADILCKTGGHWWTAGNLNILFVMHLDGPDVKTAESTKLCKTSIRPLLWCLLTQRLLSTPEWWLTMLGAWPIICSLICWCMHEKYRRR